jgi:hypothetical protein
LIVLEHLEPSSAATSFQTSGLADNMIQTFWWAVILAIAALTHRRSFPMLDVFEYFVIQLLPPSWLFLWQPSKMQEAEYKHDEGIGDCIATYKNKKKYEYPHLQGTTVKLLTTQLRNSMAMDSSCYQVNSNFHEQGLTYPLAGSW